MKPAHLYIHAAFCARRCSYCDFAVHVAAEPPVAEWIAAIVGELALVAESEGWQGRLEPETVYIGGGTPSLLGTEAMPRLRAALEPLVDFSRVAEFTAEANPESFDAALGRDWRSAGIDRISFGAQSFHGPTLSWMGRLHGPDGPARAMAAAREAGFQNLGLDLIFGLPERLGRDLDRDLDRILELDPWHVSVYGLSVEPTTPLGRWVAEGRERVVGEERYRQEYLRVSERLTDAAYSHYEVSNYGRPGREARHNGAYWQGVPYLGLGNGAHSFVASRRWWNVRDWPAYRSAVAEGRSPREGTEDVGPEAARLERLWLGLRTRRGVAWSELVEPQIAAARSWVERGLAVDEEGRIRMTLEGWLLLDSLVVQLDALAGAA